MFDVFRNYLNEKITLSEEDFELIQSVGVIKKLRKHQYLLQEGDVWRFNAFVCAGCLRTYRVDEKGEEHILYFSIENWWTGDRESLLSGNPSRSNIDAIEDSTVLLFTNDNFEMLKSRIPLLKDLVTTLIERSFIASQERIHASISQTAEQKYNHFISKFPFIVNRIPQHMIASYLGISAETLSRVRKLATRK